MLVKITYQFFLLSRSLIIIFIMLYLGKLVEHLLPIGVADSIWGMLILFILLSIRIIKLDWVYASSSLLVRYMTLLFIPFAIAIIDQTHVVWENINSVLIANFLSMFITLIIVAIASELIFNRKLKKKHAKRRIAREYRN